MAATPMGCLMNSISLLLTGLAATSPPFLRASSANHSRKELPYTISPLASVNGLPCSAVRREARSSACLTQRLYHVLSRLDLSLALVCCQVWKAVLAADTAVSVSEAVISGTVPNTDPVIGLVTSNDEPDSEPTHCPLTGNRVVNKYLRSATHTVMTYHMQDPSAEQKRT